RVSSETRAALPDILKQLPHVHASRSHCVHLDYFTRAPAAECPGHHAPSHKTRITVVNKDSFNAALDLHEKYPATAPDPCSSPMRQVRAHRPAVLSCASNSRTGGGWLRGALAQE